MGETKKKLPGRCECCGRFLAEPDRYSADGCNETGEGVTLCLECCEFWNAGGQPMRCECMRRTP